MTLWVLSVTQSQSLDLNGFQVATLYKQKSIEVDEIKFWEKYFNSFIEAKGCIVINPLDS